MPSLAGRNAPGPTAMTRRERGGPRGPGAGGGCRRCSVAGELAGGAPRSRRVAAVHPNGGDHHQDLHRALPLRKKTPPGPATAPPRRSAPATARPSHPPAAAAPLSVPESRGREADQRWRGGSIIIRISPAAQRPLGRWRWVRGAGPAGPEPEGEGSAKLGAFRQQQPGACRRSEERLMCLGLGAAGQSPAIGRTTMNGDDTQGRHRSCSRPGHGATPPLSAGI